MRVHQHGLTIASATQSGLVVLFLDGELDELTTPLLVRTLDGLTGQRFQRLWLNLSGLTGIDAGAIDALLEARRRARALGWELRIRSPSREVARMLEQRADCLGLVA
jgi:anti-anti-sigma factor